VRWLGTIMHTTWLNPKARSRQIDEGEFGVFAVNAIDQGETIAVFGGHLCDGAELRGLPEVRQSHSIQVEEDLYLVPDEEVDEGDLINHSCEPNCGLRGSSILVTMRAVAPGEQLTYDYATSDGSHYDEFTCFCGTATCRDKVTGNDWTIPELQERYRNWFSPYLQRRLGLV
jgi:SET domain-containing protein